MFREKLIDALHPIVRLPCRYIPATREFLWSKVLQPKFAWRDHDAEAKAHFGASFACNTQDIIQRYIYYFGAWEPVVTGFIYNRLSPGDTFIDIGANIGYVSLLAAAKVGPTGKVIAIEASEATFKALSENIERNHATNIRAVHGAVSDVTGELTLHAGPEGNGGMSSLVWDFGGISEKVMGAPLTRWMDIRQICTAKMIKIDVEGAEISVLRSLIPLLGKLQFNVEIACEISPKLDFEELSVVLKQFQDLDFGIYALPSDKMEHYLKTGFKPTAHRHSGSFLRTERTEMILSRAISSVLS